MGRKKVIKITKKKTRDTFILALMLAASVASSAFAADWIISNQQGEGDGYYTVVPSTVVSSADLVRERAQLAAQLGK